MENKVNSKKYNPLENCNCVLLQTNGVKTYQARKGLHRF